jgi:hypothetical protein
MEVQASRGVEQDTKNGFKKIVLDIAAVYTVTS